MKSFRHRLPSLNSLLVFEAAARLLNFTQAAKELHMSQAAVSKQIQHLENYFGFALFERHGKRVTLSGRGEQLLHKVSASFNYLADSVEEISHKDAIDSVTISANTAMSHYWLSNVISGFHRAYPDNGLNIRVITSDNTRDLFSAEVNLAIAYEPGQRIGWDMSRLFEEELFPVASPTYINHHPFQGDHPSALMTHQLLDFERIEPNWINWKVWFDALSIDTKELTISHHFNNYIVLIDAAKRGQGITLGTRFLIDQKLSEGTLVRVSSFSVLSKRSYWLAVNTAKPVSVELKRLCDWLLGSTAK